ncbi:MAG: AAA family ATPase [Candidatus Magasanikbacteria bacterium]
MDPKSYLDNLSTNLKNAIAKSISLATSLGESKVTPAHILLILQEQEGTVGAEVISKVNLKKETIEEELPRKKDEQGGEQLPELNKNSKKALEKAMLLAQEYGHNYIGTEHLLSGLVHCGDQKIENILEKNNLLAKDIDKQIEIILKSTTRFPDLDSISETLEEIKNMSKNKGKGGLPGPGNHMKPQIFSSNKSQQTTTKNQEQSVLDMFTTELTSKEIQKDIDPVIGREEEIQRLTNILCRRNKNNPVLVGEAGVGKTAIVEGLAKRITEGNVPDILKRKRVFSLDLTLLISGTIYRGEFESRLNKIVEKFKQEDDYILFIDELHNIIGTGSNQGTMDAANILKPALARGNLHCIGATTIDEYEQYITDDPALERRFQSIDIEEPSLQETKEILQGVKKHYDNYHNVNITEEAIEKATKLSNKYIYDNFLPDKALDLLDEAASSVRVEQDESDLEQKKRELEELKQDYKEKKKVAVEQENFDEALKWKKTLSTTNEKLDKIEEKLIHKKKKKEAEQVTAENVARILSMQLSVETNRLLQDEWEQLEKLDEELKNEIFGHNEVIDQVVNSLKKSYLGIHDEDIPLSSFLFAGPSGVGKTELARTLAKKLYYDEDALVKVDMSEFSEAHGVSKILGSPAGYVGHDKRNKFLEQVKKRPYSVILLDEFHEAHPDVQKLTLQILDEGELTDSTGKTISFKHAIIVLTTTMGADIFKSHGIGFDEPDNKKNKKEKLIKDKLKDSFSAPLIGRISEICPMHPLQKDDVEKIVDKTIEEISEKLKQKHNIAIEPQEEALQSLAEESFDEDTGVRHLEQIIEKTIQELVIEIMNKEKKDNKGKFELTKDSGSYKLV